MKDDTKVFHYSNSIPKTISEIGEDKGKIGLGFGKQATSAYMDAQVEIPTGNPHGERRSHVQGSSGAQEWLTERSKCDSHQHIGGI